MATTLYTAIIEKEDNGTWSAYVPGFKVYAVADSARQAKAAIKSALAAHLEVLRELHQPEKPTGVELCVMRQEQTGLQLTGIGSLLAHRTSPAKAAAARANGRKGGRPRIHATAHR